MHKKLSTYPRESVEKPEKTNVCTKKGEHLRSGRRENCCKGLYSVVQYRVRKKPIAQVHTVHMDDLRAALI